MGHGQRPTGHGASTIIMTSADSGTTSSSCCSHDPGALVMPG
jgi:hypothetical protein